MMFLTSSTHTAILTASSMSSAKAGTMIGAWPGVVTLAVRLRFGDTPGSEFGGEPKSTCLVLTNEPQLNVPGSAGGVKVGMRCANGVSATFGLETGVFVGGWARRSSSSGGLSAWRGSSGFESGPAPKGENGRLEERGVRSGWGAAMPRTWNDGRRRLWGTLLRLGVGRERSAGRKVPAKLRSRWWSRAAGDGSGWGMEDSGKGCGREASRMEEWVGVDASARRRGVARPG
jgi:hypothetical protein